MGPKSPVDEFIGGLHRRRMRIGGQDLNELGNRESGSNWLPPLQIWLVPSPPSNGLLRFLLPRSVAAQR